MKKTALNFLLEHIAEEGKDMIGRDIIEKAIVIERTQIENAFDSGYKDRGSGSDYYEEKYGENYIVYSVVKKICTLASKIKKK